MNMFSKFKAGTDGVVQDADRLGGFALKDTGVYDATIKLIYFGEYKSGAQFAEAHFDIDGHMHRERLNISTKSGENTYKDKNTGKPKFLPSFETLNDIAIVATGQEFIDLVDQIEEKTVNVYDPDLKKEAPTNVSCLIPAMGQSITLALFRQLVDKEAKDDNGNYAPTGESREENALDKVFHTETGMTGYEAKSGLETGLFIELWKKKNEGKEPRNMVKGKPNSGNSGAPSGSAAAGAPKAKSNMFNKA
jgi:hypothetical protein